ncbi:MAG: D-glycero-beta-D-manno-heptose-7-phosphate kinase [Deltaproteobacteria bacterium]|nr:D-glycero-beta-D-manno-heptose-7-phosphate kinase [Deltaproteobacteria bacterium]MBW1737044.1 D-glycero-beta-D-manno-heptose-7-phosphate kinase [Deltaproteobacteria bacterium]MBW1909611.1 D-glycero-beta-D-manno-heptose-7-phosphate kinase [Deltaproteobacteria bacterium]MBW2033608.1 D-glycero-beta-D-manno-heptose-7-phosphate kinase [Deltaproteobacteria bacterium]MBW2114234.1 D-glycero-beta-D-manno-heptose-7-phosphate kinase [Deltaproteobacteria bacterium]
MKEYIDRFPKARVLVIGDIIMDEYVWGDVSRISPEAPVPVVEVKRETKMLGGAANVINNMTTLGAKPILCGVIGKDITGEIILNNIQKMGLRTDGIVVEKDRPTSIKTRVVARNQQVVRFDRESRKDIRSESIKEILNFIGRNLDNLDAVVVSDYGKGVVSAPLMKELRGLVHSVPDGSVIIAVDPKTGNFEYYHGVDVITPNHHEAGAFCRFEILDEEMLNRAGKQIISELTCRSVLITQGRDGMTLFENSGEITHIPTVAKKVFDVTGAGDTVIGTFSLGLASGLDLKSAAILSNFAAGIVVGEVGTSTVSAEDLKKTIGG